MKFTSLSNLQKRIIATAVVLMSFAIVLISKQTKNLPPECDGLEVIYGDWQSAVAILFAGNDRLTPLMMACLYALSGDLPNFKQFSISFDGSNIDLINASKAEALELAATRVDALDTWKSRAEFYYPLALYSHYLTLKLPPTMKVRWKESTEWRSEEYGRYSEELTNAEIPEFKQEYVDLCIKAKTCTTWESSFMFFQNERLYTWFLTYTILARLERTLNGLTVRDYEKYALLEQSQTTETEITAAIDEILNRWPVHISNFKENIKNITLGTLISIYLYGDNDRISPCFGFTRTYPDNEGFFKRLLSSWINYYHSDSKNAGASFSDERYYIEKVCQNGGLSQEDEIACIYNKGLDTLLPQRRNKLIEGVERGIEQQEPTFYHASHDTVRYLFHILDECSEKKYSYCDRPLFNRKNGLTIFHEKNAANPPEIVVLQNIVNDRQFGRP